MAQRGDKIIVAAFTWIDESEADGWTPAVVLLDGGNVPKGAGGAAV